MAKKAAPKRINYNPRKTLKVMEQSLSVRAAMEPEVVRREDLKRQAIRLHIRGRDHDYISRKLHISTQEAHEFIKEKIKEYVTSESFDPAEIREIIAKRYETPLAMALQQAMPHPLKDEFGRPIIGNICHCDLSDGQLCSIPDHTAVKMSRPDREWLKVYLEVLAEQKKMYGVDAADKMKQTVTDLLERSYKGVSQDVIDSL